MKNTKTLFFFLTLAAGAVILLPFLDFQFWLAPGDHGRDLYAFKQTMAGALPYRDYFWPFGPLMPYYYGLFDRLFGVSIHSVLLGQNLLALFTGAGVYLSCAAFLSPIASLTAAFWYWAFRDMEFFYTYNHSGAVLAIVACCCCLLWYIRRPRRTLVYGGAIGLLALMLIRLNIGISTSVAFFACLFLADLLKKEKPASENLRLYLALFVLTLAVCGIVYWALIHPLPSYAVSQCFPYQKSFRNDTATSLVAALSILKSAAGSYFGLSWPSRLTGGLLLLAPFYWGSLLIKSRMPRKEKTLTFLPVISLLIFTFFNLHEFLVSGVFYRIYWAVPTLIIVIFYLLFKIMELGPSKAFTPLVRTLIIITMLAAAFFHIRKQHDYVGLFKAAGNELHVGPNRVYTSQHPFWLMTVGAATRYLEDNLQPGEKFFALPFDPLFYYLTGRDSPTRQLIFFQHNNIPPRQEKAIIGELEKQNVNYILLSNRSDSPEPGLGALGRDYCPLLAEYISERFQTVAVFGDWTSPPGWAWHYGVKILRRFR